MKNRRHKFSKTTNNSRGSPKIKKYLIKENYQKIYLFLTPPELKFFIVALNNSVALSVCEAEIKGPK